MPQADTAGQVYLELVTERHMRLFDYIQKGSTWPGQVLEERLEIKKGRIEKGYDADFSLITLDKSSRIKGEDIMSKCGWTPYEKMFFSNTVEGVIIGGVAYTQEALRGLRQGLNK